MSVDGIGSTYESLRGKPFHILRSRIDLLRTLAPVGINFVVNAATVGSHCGKLGKVA